MNYDEKKKENKQRKKTLKANQNFVYNTTGTIIKILTRQI
jgi:hypothetical protein